MSYLQKRLAERLKDPEFQQEWADSEVEYRVARNIIRMRKKMNLSQSELATIIDSKQSVISRIENGNQNMSLLTLKKIAKALNVNVMDFFESTNKSELEIVN